MPQHRGLTRRKFVDAVGAELMQEYLEGRIDVPPDFEGFDEEGVSTLLDAQSPEIRKNVEEEFYCINDVADRGMDYLERACSDYSITFDPDWPKERVAMDLFIHAPSAFRAAYDWYLWRPAANSMSHYQFIDANPQFNDSTRELFQSELDQWFCRR